MTGNAARGRHAQTGKAVRLAHVQTIVVDHPLARTRLSAVRDARSSNATFRAALAELAVILVYEASRDLAVRDIPIRTPVAETTGADLANPPLLVPVLRAGLGMLDAALTMLPECEVGFVGLARDELTHQPRTYMATLPESLAGRPVFVLDPMLATAGSAVFCCQMLADRGATEITVICALSAPEGVKRLQESGLAARLVTASIDEALNANAFIVPGLGDAGDRQFGPRYL